MCSLEEKGNEPFSFCMSVPQYKQEQRTSTKAKSDLFDETMVVAAVNCHRNIFFQTKSRGWVGGKELYTVQQW